MNNNVSVAMVATGSNPSISVGKAPNHPPPVPVYGDKWVRRIYSTRKVPQTGENEVAFTGGDFSIPGNFYVDKLQIWNASTVDGILNAKFIQVTTTDLGDDDVAAVDYGTASSMAGITFKVPLGHAKRVTNSTSQNTLVTVTSAKAGATYVVHLHCWVSI